MQQALGHNSKAVHHAHSKHAEVTVPSLDDWEKDWEKNPQRISQTKLVAVVVRAQSVVERDSDSALLLGGGADELGAVEA